MLASMEMSETHGCSVSAWHARYSLLGVRIRIVAISHLNRKFMSFFKYVIRKTGPIEHDQRLK
jgi:hypothetical protein